MSIRDYLFIDHNRLDDYIAKLGSSVVYDKVPVYGIKMEISGPEFDIKQSRFPRPLTLPEKIKELMKHLRSIKAISHGRPTHANFVNEDPIFRLECCRATKIFLPPKNDCIPHFHGINIWYSKPIKPIYVTKTTDQALIHLPSSLFLIENLSSKDNTSPIYLSAHQALTMLAGTLEKELPFTSIGENLKSSGEKIFRKDPIGTLLKLGAHPGRIREITTLYKVLYVTIEGNEKIQKMDDAELITIGYPTIIAEGTAPLDDD